MILSGWRYRGTAATGAVLLSMVAAGTAAYATAPRAWGIADPRSTLVAIVGAGVAVGIALSPLYEPRPRRVTSMLATIYERLAVACLALAAVGYVGIPHALAPAALVLFGGILGLALPVWFRSLRRRDDPRRVLVVGDDASLLASVIRAVPVRPIGYLSPVLDGTAEVGPHRPDESSREADEAFEEVPAVPDGGVAGGRISSIEGVDRLSGLSRLDHVLRSRDVDTVALAFGQADREEFFGALRTCHECGVDVLAHESLRQRLLTSEIPSNELVDVELEPWPWYGRIAKRAFDVAFAALGLMVLTPVIVLIAAAIKLDSSGPVFYGQTRTSELGGTFSVLKFRSMYPESEDAIPQNDAENDRITPVGRLLRKTHLDEIPQLGAILVGEMSVVGPRAAWVEEEELLHDQVRDWPKRWYVKPGLTGLAQIEDVDSTKGVRKLELDLEYIRRQSVLFDVTIVCTQIWVVLSDLSDLVLPRPRNQKP